MSSCLLVFLALGQDPGLVESKDFSKEAQTAALYATVKVVNVAKGFEGSGVIFKQQPLHPDYHLALHALGVAAARIDRKRVYFFTAAHVVQDAKSDEGFEIDVFTAKSYPKPAKVYRSANVVGKDKQLDLAVIELITDDPMPGLVPLCPLVMAKFLKGQKNFSGLSVGCGGGRAPVCQAETIRGEVKVRRPKDNESVLTWEVAAAQKNGRSGGPLIDKRGFIMGIASGTNNELGYYVHIDNIHQFLKRDLKWLVEEKRP